MKREDLLNTKIRIKDAKHCTLVVYKLEELGFSLSYITSDLPTHIMIGNHSHVGSNIKNFEASQRKEVFFVDGEFTFTPNPSNDSFLYVAYTPQLDRWWPNAKVLLIYQDYVVFTRKGKDKPLIRRMDSVKFKELKEPLFKIGQTIQHSGVGCMFVELTDNRTALISLKDGSLIGSEIKVDDWPSISYNEFTKIYKGIEDNCLL